ncbi:MAG: efflux transporter, family, subunit [Bryobacterales bacterium]|nr:efflux transporter, family, subunit [Bryobacterales bacterium]
MAMTDEIKETGAAKSPKRPKHHRSVLAALVALALLGAAIAFGIRSRVADANTLARATEQSAIPIVNVVHPKRGAPTSEIVLPGGAQAFVDAPIYARTNGYLKKWYFDIGARVKQGQLLAEIETPEVDQQLEQARAQLETAKANLNLAMTTADRWKTLLESDSVSKQETDQAVSNLHAQKATVDSNAANVHRLEQVQSFEKVYAPFDGIITARNTDTGALINAGAATTPGKELFHLAAIHTLRVYVSVPEVYSRAAIPGAIATLTLDEFPGQVFRGTLARNANAIDPISRTLLVEVDVDNPAGRLLPGAYMSVHLKLPAQIRSVTIPANTLLFRAEGLRVGVVKNNRAALIPAKIGRDYGDTVEVLSGLQPTDAIIVDPSDSLIDGAQVQIRESVR